jgi:hypothetical protein
VANVVGMVLVLIPKAFADTLALPQFLIEPDGGGDGLHSCRHLDWQMSHEKPENAARLT